MRYVFRHRPISGNDDAKLAAELAEYGFQTTGQFWPVHEALMERGPVFRPNDFTQIAQEFDLPQRNEANAPAWRAAELKVRDNIQSAQRGGARVTPTFFINNRRYEGAWDEGALAEVMLGSLGHRLHTASVDFVRWAPSTGFLLLLMSIFALLITNSPFGSAFQSWWSKPLEIHLGDSAFTLPLLDWVNEGLLTIFFFVVGLEIKREFTVGHLATQRAAALPVVASFGGMIVPALLYLALIPPGPLAVGWGIPIATDTAFAVALIVLLGDRVPVELRVFLTAAVIIDDLAAIAIVALFYSAGINMNYLAVSVAVTGFLIALNHWGVYRPLPYVVLGVVLWVCLHGAGLHATLTGVILAIVTPTRPPANLHALMAQAETIIQAEMEYAEESVMRHGPSEPALRALDVIHDRIESPASKLLRSIEPWSSYAVLPIFALANAGVVWSFDVIEGHRGLMLAIIFGLVLGKPLGITLLAWIAVRLGVAVKPTEYTWRQMAGAGTLAGIGFTMSLFISGQAFPNEADFAAAKIAIFVASLIAGAIGVLILWRRA
jgi:NhaA family Na+:H+ antiporter